MNVFTFGILLAIALWSMIYDRRLIMVFFGVVGLYILLEIYFRSKSYMNVRKKVSIATWHDTGDPTVHCCVDVDLTEIDKYIEKFNKRNPDNKLSYTHITLKSFGISSQIPNKNFGKICFGSFLPAPSMDLSVFAEIDEQRTANIVIRDCKNSSISDIAKQMKQKIQYLKEDKAGFKMQVKLLDYIPTFIVQIIINTLSFLSYNIGLQLPMLGMKADTFGYGVVVNVGKLDIKNLYIPLTSFTRSILVAVVNAPYDKPVIVDGKVEIRRYLDICCTFDHRFADGSDATLMLQKMKNVWAEPNNYL